MKKYICAAVLALVFAVISPDFAFGQWDYNSNTIDNIISSRIDRRRTAARIRARRGASSARHSGRHKAKKRYARRKSRRFASVEYLSAPFAFAPAADKPKMTLVV